MEKASLEKIRRLLEISKQERHYEVLLTLKNLADVRWNPAPYSFLIIQRPLPSEIVDEEHFVIADLLNLIASRASPSRDLDAETSSRELVSRTLSVPSTSTSGGSGSTQPAPSRGERGSRPKRLLLPRKGNSSTPRALKIKRRGTIKRRNAPGDAEASINTPNIGNSALIIEELDWGGQDALNTCENSFFGPHLGLGRQKNVIRLGQTPDVKLPY